MALYPFVHVSALELHALSHYPGNRQNDRMTMTDRNTNRLSYAFAAHAHRGIISILWMHVVCSICLILIPVPFLGLAESVAGRVEEIRE